jgi:hypothetical protein
MTIAFNEVPDDTNFLIKSGSGYFVNFVGNTPHMVSDYRLALEFNFYDALGILLQFEKLGYQAELVIKPIRK